MNDKIDGNGNKFKVVPIGALNMYNLWALNFTIVIQ